MKKNGMKILLGLLAVMVLLVGWIVVPVFSDFSQYQLVEGNLSDIKTWVDANASSSESKGDFEKAEILFVETILRVRQLQEGFKQTQPDLRMAFRFLQQQKSVLGNLKAKEFSLIDKVRGYHLKRAIEKSFEEIAQFEKQHLKQAYELESQNAKNLQKSSDRARLEKSAQFLGK
jgi:hypothetical protein